MKIHRIEQIISLLGLFVAVGIVVIITILYHRTSRPVFEYITLLKQERFHDAVSQRTSVLERKNQPNDVTNQTRLQYVKDVSGLSMVLPAPLKIVHHNDGMFEIIGSNYSIAGMNTLNCTDSYPADAPRADKHQVDCSSINFIKDILSIPLIDIKELQSYNTIQQGEYVRTLKSKYKVVTAHAGSEWASDNDSEVLILLGVDNEDKHMNIMTKLRPVGSHDDWVCRGIVVIGESRIIAQEVSELIAQSIEMNSLPSK